MESIDRSCGGYLLIDWKQREGHWDTAFFNRTTLLDLFIPQSFSQLPLRFLELGKLNWSELLPRPAISTRDVIWVLSFFEGYALIF